MSRPSLRLALARSRGALARPSPPLLALSSSTARRSSSSSSRSLPPTGTYKVFDRDNVLHHRELAYAKDGGKRSRTVGYLREEIGERVMERFEVRLKPCTSCSSPREATALSDKTSKLTTRHACRPLSFQDVKPPPSDPTDPDAPPRPLDLLEITAGPGTFARLIADDPDRIASVEVMEWSRQFSFAS